MFQLHSVLARLLPFDRFFTRTIPSLFVCSSIQTHVRLLSAQRLKRASHFQPFIPALLFSAAHLRKHQHMVSDDATGFFQGFEPAVSMAWRLKTRWRDRESAFQLQLLLQRSRGRQHNSVFIVYSVCSVSRCELKVIMFLHTTGTVIRMNQIMKEFRTATPILRAERQMSRRGEFEMIRFLLHEIHEKTLGSWDLRIFLRYYLTISVCSLQIPKLSPQDPVLHVRDSRICF